jgi:hypothetical protein
MPCAGTAVFASNGTRTAGFTRLVAKTSAFLKPVRYLHGEVVRERRDESC